MNAGSVTETKNDEPRLTVRSIDPEPHNIVYGKTGFYDGLDNDSIAALVAVGAIVLDRSVPGSVTVTHLYRSVEGLVPGSKV